MNTAVRGRSGGLHGLGDVARDYVPPHGLIWGLVEGDVELVHAGRSGPGGELVLIEARHVRGGELPQLQPSEMGLMWTRTAIS